MSHRDSIGSPETIQPDDPRLTAYALGAMGADEAAAFEALLATDADARAEVEAIRVLAGDLEAEFTEASAANNAAEGLDADRRAAVLAAGSEAVVASSTPPRGRRLLLWSAVATAASVLVGVPILLGLWADSEYGATRESTQLERRPSLIGTTSGPAPADGSLPAGDAHWNDVFKDADIAELQDRLNAETERANRNAVNATSTRNEVVDVMKGGAEIPRKLDGWTRLDEVTNGVGSGPAVPVADPAAPVVRPTFGQPKTKPENTVGLVLDGKALGRQGLGGQAGRMYRYDLPGGSVLRVEPQLQGANGPIMGVPVDPADIPAGFGSSDMYAGFGAGGYWAGWNARVHGEHYVHPGIDGFMAVTKRGGHTSTFSVDVDTASYTNVRRLLNAGQRPHPAAVRLEELVNYFDYDYAPPAADAKEPFAQHIQVATCPWNVKHRLVRIALKGKEIERAQRPASNLVFLVDVSGSMKSEDKLPLLQSALEMLVENLDARDRISVVTYASSATLALESTNGDQRDEILAKIRSLKAGGGTNGAGGIQLAYAEAQKHFLQEGTNRVILCTDGDFNVGVSDGPGLTRLVQEKAKGGVYLSVLGFGTGNLQDGKMEAYSNAGNGNYAYIDGLDEAKRVLVEQMEGTLITIAKDVKFQVWFNPKTVHAWRLLGYENRRLAARDFNDDSKDAGDIGAGHEVTALYELVPTGVALPDAVDPNPFLEKTNAPKDEGEVKVENGPLPRDKALFVWRLRWKQPDGDTSELVERNVFDEGLTFEQADGDFQWAAGVTAFGMLLRHSPHRGQASWALVEELACPVRGEDPSGRRAEFLGLVAKARGQ